MNPDDQLRLIVLHVLSLRPNYGYEIARQVKLQAEGLLDFREGTLYPLLHKLEKDGLLEAYIEPRTGKYRRFYKLTDAGKTALNDAMAAWSAPGTMQRRTP